MNAFAVRSLPADDPLTVENLSTVFATAAGPVAAVRDVSFSIGRGRTLALVGESGSGKSVTCLSIMRLLDEPRGRIASGSVRLRGKDGATHDLARLDENALRKIRGKDVAMIFQEPMTSLNPVTRVGDQIAESILLHEPVGRGPARARALDLMRRVEIADAERRVSNYPHQMSGGMRQRVMIAMALACNPTLLIADEPTTALDVTVQAQVLALMRRLQTDVGMAMLFVTHDLGIVAAMASDVAVMYGGMIVEIGDVRAIFRRPRHPYTAGLLASLPRLSAAGAGRKHRLAYIPGSVPPAGRSPPGCPFSTRCAHRVDDCDAALPALAEAAPGHKTRCLRWAEAT